MRTTSARATLLCLSFLTALVATACTDEATGDDPTGDGEPGVLFGIRCPGCTYNGFAKRPSDYLPGQMSRSALKKAGLYGVNGPKAICTSATATSCTCQAGWAAWLDNDTTATHVKQFTYLAKIVAPSGFTIHCGAYSYPGDAGIAPAAITSEWTYRDQEVITGGFVALLNTVGGVPACLTTRDIPGGCTGGGFGYEESVTFGTTFLGGGNRHIAGGRKLGGLHYNPERLKRPCTSNVNESCASHIENRYPSADGNNPSPHTEVYCQFASREGYRHATRCRDTSGVWWNNPVTVRLDVAPENNGYYFTQHDFQRPGCGIVCAAEY